MIPLVRQVMHQTRERLFNGNTHVPGKLVSLFEPHTEVIRKGKAAKPTEFGKMVKIQEAENQIVTALRSLRRAPQRQRSVAPGDSLCIEKLLGRMPHLVTADTAFFSAAQRSRRSSTGRKASRHSQPFHQECRSASDIEKKRWFQNAQKWRTGCEGRISLLKRRHGLNRCRTKAAA